MIIIFLLVVLLPLCPYKYFFILPILTILLKCLIIGEIHKKGGLRNYRFNHSTTLKKVIAIIRFSKKIRK